MKPESSYRIVHAAALRLLAAVYFFAFFSLLLQGPALFGASPDGLLPFDRFLQRLQAGLGGDATLWDNFLAHPTLFWILPWTTDALRAVAAAGVALSLLAFVGLVNAPLFAALWLLYNSLSAVGQLFTGYGWELQISETGFLAVFALPLLAPAAATDMAPPRQVVWLNRWLIARIMLGAGLIKIRGDPCWRDLTCLAHHYETQPIPNPASWYLHHAPPWVGVAGVVVNHAVELAAPLLLLGGRTARLVAGALFVAFQLTLIVSGNLSFLNWLTIVPALWCFDDEALRATLPAPALAAVTAGLPYAALGDTGAAGAGAVPSRAPSDPVPQSPCPRARAAARSAVAWALLLLVAALSRAPVRNLVDPGQAMNRGYDPLHLVNTYGAFGSVGKRRHEVVLWGTDAPSPDATGAVWREIGFKCKPTGVNTTPCVQAPYHHRLDWQIWFAAMQQYEGNPWLLHLCAKLLAGEEGAWGLLAAGAAFGPADAANLTFVRVDLYRVRFTRPGSAAARRGNWYTRKFVGPYIPVPLSLNNPSFRRALEGQGWVVPKAAAE